MTRILHFADAHIDMANYGRHDPVTGLPIRVMDFLRSLDEIVDAAVHEEVELVIFAGDAYKDRNPAPTYQREWGRRIMRLSQAGIPTLLLVGNHDLSPAVGRAHALSEFSTLDVPHLRTIDRPTFLSAQDLTDLSPEGTTLNAQVLAIPWISRSGMIAYLDLQTRDLDQVHEEMEKRLSNIIEKWLEEADPDLPTILTAHASVAGATYGNERTVMLGKDLVLPKSLLVNPAVDYVALGHIHKPQNLNEGTHPPVIYPGSIERIDFGEAGDQKYYLLAEVERGNTQVEWRELQNLRPFLDAHLELATKEDLNQQILEALPDQDQMAGAVVRLVLRYPRAWEPLIDFPALHDQAEEAFEFHLVKQPITETRIRLPEDQAVGSLSPETLLDHYWRASHTPQDEAEELNQLAAEIFYPEGEEDEA